MCPCGCGEKIHVARRHSDELVEGPRRKVPPSAAPSSQLLLSSWQVRRVDPEQTNRSSNHGRAQRRPSAICRAAHGEQALEM